MSRGNVITQFMWGYQPHFRSGLESAVDGALAKIGIQIESEVYLIGFLKERGERLPICIEPEAGPWLPSHFAEVLERAVEIYEQDPERQLERPFKPLQINVASRTGSMGRRRKSAGARARCGSPTVASRRIRR